MKHLQRTYPEQQLHRYKCLLRHALNRQNHYDVLYYADMVAEWLPLAETDQARINLQLGTLRRIYEVNLMLAG